MNTQESQKFFSTVSFGGLLAIYALKLSLENKTAFDQDDFAKNAYPLSKDYFSGFIVACVALGAIDFNNKGSIITVLSVDPLLSASVEQELKKQAEDDENWKKMIKDVKKYF